jgi:hypothetical protein
LPWRDARPCVDPEIGARPATTSALASIRVAHRIYCADRVQAGQTLQVQDKKTTPRALTPQGVSAAFVDGSPLAGSALPPYVMISVSALATTADVLTAAADVLTRTRGLRAGARRVAAGMRGRLGGGRYVKSKAQSGGRRRLQPMYASLVSFDQSENVTVCVLLPIVLQMAYHCGQRVQCCDIRTYGAPIDLPGLRLACSGDAV